MSSSLSSPFSPFERCLIHSIGSSGWIRSSSSISLSLEAFAEGSFRLAYKATIAPLPGCISELLNSFPLADETPIFVCKFARDSASPRQLYFADVEAQTVGSLMSKEFNAAQQSHSNSPPHSHQFSFVPAFVIEFVDRPGRPCCGCELYLTGEFRKHNNNVGAVEKIPTHKSSIRSNDEYFLPLAQAFSHFTFAISSGAMLICDIQGVGDHLTDPQIHTASGKGFGQGNLGSTGMKAFLMRHQCNARCQSIGLAATNNWSPAQNNEIANFFTRSIIQPPAVSAISQAISSPAFVGSLFPSQPASRRTSQISNQESLIARPAQAQAQAQRGSISSVNGNIPINPFNELPNKQNNAAAISEESEEFKQTEVNHTQPASSKKTDRERERNSNSNTNTGNRLDCQSLPTQSQTQSQPQPQSHQSQFSIDDSDEALMESILKSN